MRPSRAPTGAKGTACGEERAYTENSREMVSARLGFGRDRSETGESPAIPTAVSERQEPPMTMGPPMPCQAPIPPARS